MVICIEKISNCFLIYSYKYIQPFETIEKLNSLNKVLGYAVITNKIGIKSLDICRVAMGRITHKSHFFEGSS